MFHVIIYYRPVAVLTWYRFSTIGIFKEVLYQSLILVLQQYSQGLCHENGC